MRPRQRRGALVVVRDGPASERGWLALRTALALGLGGFDVHVWLMGSGVAFAAPGLDVATWLGGDPKAEVRGLLEELGAQVHTASDGVTFATHYAEAAITVCS